MEETGEGKRQNNVAEASFLEQKQHKIVVVVVLMVTRCEYVIWIWIRGPPVVQENDTNP